MNDNVYGFDFNCYHISDDFNYPGNSSALSDILSNTNSLPVTSSLSTNSLNSSLQPNLSAYSHCNPNMNLNSSLNTSLNSSSSSLSSCSSSTPSPSNLSPHSSSATSPSSLSSSSSSCISITSMIDFQKLKHEMTNNIVKPKSERKSSNPTINLSSFSICQSKMETQPQSTSSSHSLQSNPSNNSTPINNINQNNHQSNQNNINNNNPTHNSSSSHEFTEEEKEGLQISPFLSSVQENYCDITEYLTLPQNQAAKKLQMRPSTFSKRWKEASRNRKWPWRNVRKIDKEITCILHNMPKNGQISEEIESHLTYLLKQRQEELKPVVIRIS